MIDRRSPEAAPNSFDVALMKAAPVSVVIPVRAGVDSLRPLLDAVPEGVREIILVNQNLGSGPIEEAKRQRSGVVEVSQTGRGKGNALACGFRNATGEIIVTLEADGSTDPREMPRYVAALLAGADFAKGSRFVVGGGHDLARGQRIANRLATGAANRVWKLRYTDVGYGYNAFWCRVLPVIAPDTQGLRMDALMSLRAVRAGLTVHEVPSQARGMVVRV